MTRIKLYESSQWHDINSKMTIKEAWDRKVYAIRNLKYTFQEQGSIERDRAGRSCSIGVRNCFSTRDNEIGVGSSGRANYRSLLIDPRLFDCLHLEIEYKAVHLTKKSNLCSCAEVRCKSLHKICAKEFTLCALLSDQQDAFVPDPRATSDSVR